MVTITPQTSGPNSRVTKAHSKLHHVSIESAQLAGKKSELTTLDRSPLTDVSPFD